MEPRHGGKGWIAFAVINALVTFFGLSYIFFPMGTVVEDGNTTTGILDVPREIWGSYVVLSALALLAVAMTGYRRGERWAFLAMIYQFVFFLVVVVVEPDPVTPVLFGLVLGIVMYRGRGRFLSAPGSDRDRLAA